MKRYECIRCSNAEMGDFIFCVLYPAVESDVEATRCPKCGALVSGKDVKEI